MARRLDEAITVFCPQGWNKGYPFNTGDLVISMNVLYNYLEANNRS